MKPILGALAAGVAGNALFALVTKWIPFVEGAAWWWSMSGVFVVFAVITYGLLSQTAEAAPVGEPTTGSVGSGLESGEGMEVELGRVKIAGKDHVQVLSGNKSKGPMNLSAEDVDIT